MECVFWLHHQLTWALNPESSLAIDVDITGFGLKTRNPEVALCVEEYHDPTPCTPPLASIGHRSNKVDGPGALDLRLDQVDAATRIKDSSAKAVEILVGRCVF